MSIKILLSEIWKPVNKILFIIIFVELSNYLFIKQNLKKEVIVPDSYKEADWFSEYWEELSMICNDMTEWSPYVHWQLKPYSGKYINIKTDSTRKTWNSFIKSEIKIFMFGGSTMWGYGARDDYTIPSLTAKILYEKFGINAEIVNYGQLGYINTQELMKLILLIQEKNIPSLVIFYDGINDVFSTFAKEAGIKHRKFEMEQKSQEKLLNKLLDIIRAHSFIYSIINHLVNKFHPKKQVVLLDDSKIKKIPSIVMQKYTSNLKIISALAKNYSFEYLFYLQPTIYEKKSLTLFENETISNTLGINADIIKLVYHNSYNQILNQVSQDHFIDISRFFENETESLYIDPWHINEYGNKLIAEKIAHDIFKYFYNTKYK